MSAAIQKIVLFGPESTGKTQLAIRLAEHYRTLWVPEYARTYLESKQLYFDKRTDSNEICTENDILPIVLGQINTEDIYQTMSDKFIVCDTNPLETKVYVNYYFNTEYGWLNNLVKERKYDFYLLTDIDVEWQPDPMRAFPVERQKLFSLFENELIKTNQNYEKLTGLGENRFENAIKIIDRVLNS